MWSKEIWESRWRLPILTAIGVLIACLYPLLFTLMRQVPAHGLPPSVAPLLHYPAFAYTWFGEDLPELLLIYAVLWAIAAIAREWQSGSVEFLAQLPLNRRQIALQKGIVGSVEIVCVSVIASAALWGASAVAGHDLPLGPYGLSVVFLITVGFVGILWLASVVAWALHSVYSVALVGVVIFAWSLITRSVLALVAWAPLTYVSNVLPHPNVTHIGEHVVMAAVVTVGLAWLTLWVADRQDFVSQHGRDQI